MLSWLSSIKAITALALLGWTATGLYLLWFLRDSGIEQDLFRNTDEDRQAYLLVIGTWMILMGSLLLCLGMAGSGSSLVTAGVSMLIGKSWLAQNTQKTITTAKIASQTTIATTKTTIAMEASKKPAPNPSTPKPKPSQKKPGTDKMDGGEGK